MQLSAYSDYAIRVLMQTALRSPERTLLPKWRKPLAFHGIISSKLCMTLAGPVIRPRSGDRRRLHARSLAGSNPAG